MSESTELLFLSSPLRGYFSLVHFTFYESDKRQDTKVVYYMFATKSIWSNFNEII